MQLQNAEISQCVVEDIINLQGNEIARLRHGLDEANGVIDALKKTAAEDGEAKNLRQELRSIIEAVTDIGKLQENVRTTESVNEALRGDIKNLEEQLDESRTALESTKEQLSKTLASEAASLQDVERLATLNSGLSTELSTVNGNCINLDEKLAQCKSENELVSNEASALRASQSALRDRLNSYESENELLSNEVSALRASQSAMQDRLNSYESENELYSNEVSALRASQSAMQDRLNSCQSENELLSNEVSTLEASQSALRDRLNGYESENELLSNEVPALRASQSAMQDSLDGYEMRYAGLSAENRSLSLALEEIQHSSNDKVSDAEKVAKNAKEAQVAAEEELSLRNETCNSLQNQISTLTSNLHTNEIRLRDLEQEIFKEKDCTTLLRVELSAAHEKINRHETIASELREHTLKLQEELDACKASSRSASGKSGRDDQRLEDDPAMAIGETLLDRVNEERFGWTSYQVTNWANKSRKEDGHRTLSRVVRLLLDKATSRDDPNWAQLYARLCVKLMQDISPDVRSDDVTSWDSTPVSGGKLVHMHILDRLQGMFDQYCEHVGTTTLGANETSAVHQAGLCQLIGELLKHNILTARTVRGCINRLDSIIRDRISKTDPFEEVDVLCKLLKTVGPLLDNSSSTTKSWVDTYFSGLETLCKTNDVLVIAPNARSSLQGVVELRKRNWMPLLKHRVGLPSSTTP